MVTRDLKQKALRLKPLDKIRLIELLFESLDQADPAIEQEWAKESDRRLKAYERGQIRSKDVNKVIEALRR